MKAISTDLPEPVAPTIAVWARIAARGVERPVEAAWPCAWCRPAGPLPPNRQSVRLPTLTPVTGARRVMAAISTRARRTFISLLGDVAGHVGERGVDVVEGGQPRLEPLGVEQARHPRCPLVRLVLAVGPDMDIAMGQGIGPLGELALHDVELGQGAVGLGVGAAGERVAGHDLGQDRAQALLPGEPPLADLEDLLAALVGAEAVHGHAPSGTGTAARAAPRR